MVQIIKGLRLNIDGIAQLIHDYNGQNSCISMRTMQIYEAKKSVLLAKAWLGKVLGLLGQETPYKNDGNRHSVSDIEPTDARKDLDYTNIEGWKEKNEVEKVDCIRQLIQEVINKLEEVKPSKEVIQMASEKVGRIVTFTGNTHMYLIEARFHLGFELERIRLNS
jgi:hypothetical protein